MMPLLEIEADSKTPIYLQVVNAVTHAIRRGKLRKGEKLLSINELSEEYLISRVTVEKAYSILKERGTILPVKGKGFYINEVTIAEPVKVLLLFNKISVYKKQIYHGFIERMGGNAIVDLKIHGFNVHVLKKMVEEHLNDYDYFVIMPFFYDHYDEAIELLRSIPPDQLLLIDKNIPALNKICGAVYQDFENDLIHALEQGLDLLQKYQKLYLSIPSITKQPTEIIYGFRKFCMQNSFKGEVIKDITLNTPVSKGDVFIVIEESDLANLVKICRQQNLQVGKDVGIISYNETPLKEVLLDGITVISTDHAKMGETAAELILNNSKENIRNPFKMIKRNSL